MKVLKSDYIPAYPEIFSAEVAETLDMPEHLFLSLDDESEIVKELKTKYDVIQETKPITAQRFLDNYEIRELRDAYADVLENDMPEYKEAEEQLKAELTAAK